MKQMLLRKRIFRAAAMLVCLMVLLSASAATAFAYGRIDTEAEISLTAYFTDNDTGMEGASFRLYRVADVSDAVEFTLAGDFSDASVSLDDVESAGDWTDMAVTLSAYADANGISAGFTGTTDENGMVSFSGLTAGLYLLVGDAVVIGDYSCSPAPSIIMLPALLDDDSWEYAPTADIKYTKTLLTEYRDITVKKVWNDGSGSNRPDSVKVQLLQNGTVQETVTLNADNNWTYTWENLSGTCEGEEETKACTWSVNEESVPAGYTVSVSKNNDTFTVTNTCKNTGETPTVPTLPQTGTLNWPVPVLTISGLLLVGLGWYLFSRKKEN